MKRIFWLFLFFAPALLFAQPCSTTNATGCDCPDGSTACDLIPDLTISWYALQNYDNGPNEYSQSGNGLENGRLRLTGSTPNIGWGPLTIRGTDTDGYRRFVCGTDTFSIHDPGSTVEFTCPNGHPEPKQIIFQRIYQKNNGAMTYYDRASGTMTYHASHGHNHVDDWVTFTLRAENPNEPDTLKWPVIGTGAKIGFCLMDYGNCNDYAGHCRSVQSYGGGTVLTSASFPNYGLGGGQYNCSPIEQGISVGFTDIYGETLDGMWINIPPNTCNGTYWIIAEVDPQNNFLEINDGNNWTAIPYTLTRQLPAGSAVAEITLDKSPYLCGSSEVTLQSTLATSYLWSNGATTPSISVSTPGDYFVQTNSMCGQAVSDTITIIEINSAVTAFEQDTTCVAGTATLAAQGTGTVSWYDAPADGNLLLTGNTLTTAPLQSSETYYAENLSVIPGTVAFCPPANHTGSTLYSATNFNSYLIFDCISAFTLKTVKVYTDSAGPRTIELRDEAGIVLQDTTVNIGIGASRITLDFDITPGTNYQLGTNAALNNTNFGYNSPALRRTNGGVSFPYTIPNVLSIHNTTNGETFYYYFYDWEVEYGKATCISPRVPVEAVVAPPPPVSISGLDTAYQINTGVVTMTGQPAGGQFSGNGVSGSVFDPVQAGLGVHTITYDYTDTLGCSNSASIDVRVRIGQITASAGSNTEICIGASTTLTASGGTIFIWSTGEQTESIVVNPLTTTTYSVTVSDTFGAMDVADVTVTVNTLPVADITGLDAEYFVNENAVTLSGMPSGGTFGGDGVSGNTFEPALAGVGLHLITYNYTDQHGCSAADSQQVNIKQSVVTASITGDDEICAGDSVAFLASGGTQYLWSTGDQAAAIAVAPAQTTTYSVTVSDNFGSSDAADITITVHAIPAVDFTGLPTEAFVNAAPITLSGTPAGGIFAGQGVSGTTFNPADAGVGGPYSIAYSYTDGNGCENESVKTILVKQLTGINPVAAGSIRVYPNPTNSLLVVDFSGLKNESVMLRVWNSVGKEVIAMPLLLANSSAQSTLDFTAVPPGIYFLEVVTQDGVVMQKVVRE